MSQLSSSTWGPWERGGRRKKVYDYLKAANELRQSYTSQWTGDRNGSRAYDDEYFNTPGAFPDVEIARSGDEEMVLFPSYARRLSKNRHQPDMFARKRRDSTSTIDEYLGGSENAEYERDDLEGEGYVDPNAIVDVDVRGWVYAPHRGPMTRKHRLMIGLARKLSGVPAPTVNSTDIGETNSINGKGEEEFVNKEMQSILNKGETSADPAWKGSAAATPSSSTTEPSQLSKDEISMANAHLMERLRPFLTNPISELPVTVFFFNDEKSQSRNIMTDESGHFSLREALPFIPTHIRVLASEDLSAAKAIEIIEPIGVSLISDIDDTVKHSAIANGAKEIFRNTFVRELAELTVDGVTDWYTRLAKMGVEMHYVSNAPWQLYPLLERYFRLVGLPPGSFHLKYYAGMLQGIFEPTAERKKGSLERILRDFPERKFILVGDSGEADLEVYTDIVLANPGRILGIFIRDVTTPEPKKFFEKSVDYMAPVSRSRTIGQLVDDSDVISNRPVLPPRRPLGPDRVPSDSKSIDNADLIDLSDEGQNTPSTEQSKPAISRPPPTKPSKPSSLRAASTNPELGDTKEGSDQDNAIRRKPPPPAPRRRTPNNASPSDQNPTSNAATGNADGAQNGTYTDTVKNVVGSGPSPLPTAADYLPIRPRGPGQNTPGAQTPEAKAAQGKQPPPPPPPRRTQTGASTTSSPGPNMNRPENLSRPEAQKQQSYPAAAATAAFQYASDGLSWASTRSGLRPVASNSSLSRANSEQEPGRYGNSSAPPAPLPNRREELWRRRWERASEVLEDRGVLLGSWRVGSDAQDVSIWLVEEALKEIRKGQAGPGK